MWGRRNAIAACAERRSWHPCLISVTPRVAMQGGTKRKAATSKGRPKVNPQCCRNDRTGERYCARPAQKTTSRGQAESAQPFRQRGAAGKVFARPGAPVMIGIGAVEPAGSDQATDDTWSTAALLSERIHN
jgi:hypothetical protein